jgi:hypothetical protein
MMPHTVVGGTLGSEFAELPGGGAMPVWKPPALKQQAVTM